MSLPPHRVAGDVIDVAEWNLLIDAIGGLFDFVHVENRALPFQVDKASILLLEISGTSTIGFPNNLIAYISADGVIYEEIGGIDFPFDGHVHVSTLTVPIPKDYFVYWTVPYGILKSAVLF